MLLKTLPGTAQAITSRLPSPACLSEHLDNDGQNQNPVVSQLYTHLKSTLQVCLQVTHQGHTPVKGSLATRGTKLICTFTMKGLHKGKAN